MEAKGWFAVSWWLILLLLFIVVLFIVMVTKIRIIIAFHHFQSENQLKITMKVWFGLLKFTFRIPQAKQAGESSKEEDKKASQDEDKSSPFDKDGSPQQLLTKIPGLYRIVKQFLSHVTIHQFEWHTEIGTGDAANTGMISGLVWSLKGNMIALMSHYMRLITKPTIHVAPSFQSLMLTTRLECIFSFRVGYAIGAGLKIAKHWKRTSRVLTKNNLSQKA